MKVTIQGKAVFTVPMGRREIQVLILLSMNHYDGICKGASSPPPLGDGFLLGWRNRLDALEYQKGTPEKDYTVSGDFRRFDLVSKILEGWRYLPTIWQRETGCILQNQIHRMLIQSNEITPTWNREIEV